MADRTRILDPHRLAVLDDLAIMDTPAEPAYDDIARLASACCDSEIAAVNFVDDHRHWTKAIAGVEGGRGASVPSEVSFCAETVASAGGVLCIPDTTGDERWRSHPQVVDGPKVRFYAGASVVVGGEPIGVVCVFGDQPRVIGRRDEQALEALARQASAQLELRKRNTELRELAVTDPLTGLANRTLLEDHLELAIAQRARDGGHIGVLFCDLDGFKGVNDQQGHEAGDRVLCGVAECLHQATRAVDTVARVGGDEFVVLCPGLESSEELGTVVSRVGATLRAARAEDAGALPRLSIGATLLGDDETAAGVLARADAAMYADKVAARCTPPRLAPSPVIR